MHISSPPPLSEFLRIADEVSAGVSAADGPGLRLVRDVDDLIRNRLFGLDVRMAPLSANLAMASYFSFLGGVRVALSGHAAGIFPLIRHSLECACYAYRLEEEPNLVEVWLHRHRGANEQRACRRAFSSAVSDVSASVAARQENLGKLVADLYQASIDFGAHPNPMLVVNHLSIENQDDGMVRVDMTCLYGAENTRVQGALVACAETGIASAFVIALAANDHPLIDEEYSALAGIYDRVQAAVDEVKRGEQEPTGMNTSRDGPPNRNGGGGRT